MSKRDDARAARIAEARRLQRAAGQKASRLRRQGVRLNDLDPRIHNPDFTAMSGNDLRAYTRSLARFTSRDTNFVAGMNGTPISSARWQEYKRLERAFNKRVAQYDRTVADIRIPTVNQTIAERREIVNKGPRAGGDFRTFQQLHREAGKLTGEEAVEKYITAMRKKLDPGYLNKEAKQDRKILTKMLKTSGDTDVLKKIKKLSDMQLSILVNETDFMNIAGGRYAMATSISSDTPRWQSQVYENAGEKLHTLSDWAEQLPGAVDEQRPVRRGTPKNLNLNAEWAGTLPEFRSKRRR